MTRFYLVRHGRTATTGRALADADEPLADEGRAEAGAVADHLAGARLAAVVTSPLPRTRATAEAIAAAAGVPLLEEPDLREVDFGAWIGRSFEALEADPRWRAWNRCRGVVRAPGGESMVEVQARAAGALLRLRDAHPDARVAVVSHADVLRALLVWALGVPLDHLPRLEVGPASVSVLEVGEDWIRVVRVNGGPAG